MDHGEGPRERTIETPGDVVSAAPIEGRGAADRISELYAGGILTPETAAVARDRIHWMCSQCRGDTVLDIGCSQGIVTVLLAREGLTVTGLDNNPDAIAYARRASGREPSSVQARITWIECDLVDLPESERFDTVVLGEVLEHQAQPGRFFALAARHLESNGRLVLTAPFGVHPHDDHKCTVLPSQLVDLAAVHRLGIAALDVVDGYIRMTFAAAANDVGTSVEETRQRLVALTEKGALASQAVLYARLRERSEQLKKKAWAVRSLETQLATAKEQQAETREAVTEAQNAVREKQSALERAIREKNEALEETRRLTDEALARQRQEFEETLARERSQHGAQARLKAAQAQERLVLKTLDAESSVKRTISFQLGYLLVHGFKSPAAAARLPLDLLRLRDEARARRKARLARSAKPRDGEPGASSPRAAPAGSMSETAVPSEALLELYKEHGIGALTAEVGRITRGRPARQRAELLLRASLAIRGHATNKEEMQLAEMALAADSSEPTMIGFAEIGKKVGAYGRVADVVETLEKHYGPQPNQHQQRVLNRLKAHPAYILSALDAIEPRRPVQFGSIPRRICYVLHNSLPYSSGGYATRSHGVAGGLTEAGYEVIITTRPGFPVDLKNAGIHPDSVAPSETIDGISYVRTLEPHRGQMHTRAYILSAAEAMETRFRDLRPELVIGASNSYTALPALIAAHRVGLPFIYEVRGLWEITRMSRDRDFSEHPQFTVLKKLEAATAISAEHVFTLTGAMRDEMIARGTPPDRIELLPNCCDPSRFLPRPRDAELAATLGIPADVPVIGYIGTFVDYEGLDDLAVACAILNRRGTTFRLLLVGNENASGQERGPITAEIGRIAAEGGFSDWLIMPGRVPHDQVDRYYSLIDVAPFPRKPWPVCEMVSPMKPLEALAMEKAVVISSVRAMAEMIEHERTGLSFEKDNVESLASTLQRLIASPELRQTLGRQGRAWVEAERTWRQSGAKAAQRITEIIGRPAARV
ncbi:MAG: glycosyltransferase [Deltaproteobacteria bacterium]|nr:glycosyltransferase [Deltaproteobacteria bacterium]